jgi:DNA-binding CsgD family transcriptional regulator
MVNPINNLRMSLTSREKQVLQLAVTGASQKQIADSLGIAHNTVRTHIRHIYDKSGMGNRVELVHWAQKNGLLHWGGGETPASLA